MKKIISLAFFISLNVSACPVIQGVYKCKMYDNIIEVLRLREKPIDNGTLYDLDFGSDSEYGSAHYLADGALRIDASTTAMLERVSSCLGSPVSTTLTFSYMDSNGTLQKTRTLEVVFGLNQSGDLVYSETSISLNGDSTSNYSDESLCTKIADL